MHIAVSRPFGVLERRLHRLGAVLCGWQGVEGLCGKALFPLEHKDLFPAGSVKLNGVKFYGDREPDQVVTYTSALISANGGALVEVFEQLRDSRGGKMMLVDNLLMGNGDVTMWIALVVSLALVVTVILAKLVGCVLPLVAKKLGFDPAVMASPFITTIVDALSLLIYFMFATMILNL
jgi:hypothetical protein